MAEVNQRWEELVKHASERLSRLEPIVNIVQQFDAVKDPLNEWVSHKSEDLESLLPLEVETLPEQQKEMEVFLSSILERAADVTLLEELAEKFCKEIEVTTVMHVIGQSYVSIKHSPSVVTFMVDQLCNLGVHLSWEHRLLNEMSLCAKEYEYE